jgi:acid stress chaperone HdeA
MSANADPFAVRKKDAHAIVGWLSGDASERCETDARRISIETLCSEDFVSVDEVYRPTLVYWVARVARFGVKETDTMVIDTAHPAGEVVAQECRKDPHARFVSKVRTMFKANQIAL